MKRSFLLIILFLISLCPLIAVDLFAAPLTAASREKVEAIFAEISTHPFLRSDFTQAKTIKKFNRTITSTGRMLFDSKKGIAWIFEKPFPMTTVLTGDAMIQRTSDGQERVLSAAGNESFQRFSTTVQSIFLGKIDTITSEYNLFYLDGEDGSWRIGLVPKDSTLKGIVSAFELEGHDFIETFIIRESGGDLVTYKFSNSEFPAALSPEESRVFP